MKRWDLVFVPRLAGSDSEMVACDDGDWVTHADAIGTIDDVRRDSRAASRVDTLAMVRDVLHARSQDASPPTLADMVEWLDAEIRRGQS